jgi:hypothetical protein
VAGGIMPPAVVWLTKFLLMTVGVLFQSNFAEFFVIKLGHGLS